MNYGALFLLLGVLQLEGMAGPKEKNNGKDDVLTRRNSLELEVIGGKVSVSRNVVDRFHKATDALRDQNAKLEQDILVSNAYNKQLTGEIARLVLQNQGLYASASYLQELQKNNGALFSVMTIQKASDAQPTVILSVEKVTDLANKLKALAAAVDAGSDPALITQNTALRQQNELLIAQVSQSGCIPKTFRECRMVFLGIGVAFGATVLQQLLYDQDWCVCLP